MKKIVCMLAAVMMIVSLFTGMTVMAEEPETDAQAAEVVQDITNYLWDIPDDASEEEYIRLMDRNFRIIQAFELLFTEDSYEAYSKVYARQFKRTKSYEDAQKVVEAQSLLVQKTSITDGAWFLWGTNEEDNANGYAWFTGNVGPVVAGEEEALTEEALDASAIDGYGQGPVLIKCLLDDPTQAKGNIVLISGGGFGTRSNPAEGYAAIPCFNGLGYNCFLLQRRVAPYSVADIAMDMQRSIRLVKYYGEQEGWGGMDMIAAAGFSGGGGTIMAAVSSAYGDMTPADEGAASYVPDEIDAVNSDLDVALIAYGAAGSGYPEENPNWPATYITYGKNDSEGIQEGCEALFAQLDGVVPAQIYAIDDVGHGFGVGQASTVPETVALWPLQADEFMQSLR